MSENQKEEKVQIEASKSEPESSITEDSEGVKNKNKRLPREGTTSAPEFKQDDVIPEGKAKTSETSAPSLHKISFTFIALPQIFAICLFTFTTIVAKIMIWFIGRTIGISEEGEFLIYDNVSSGTTTGVFICFVTPHVFKLLKMLNIEIPKNINLKSIRYGILLGVVFFIIGSFATAIRTISENSSAHITQAIYAIGLLCGGCAWKISDKLVNKLSIFKRREQQK